MSNSDKLERFEKFIEQTYIHQPELDVTIAALWTTNDVPLLDALFDKPSTMREKFEIRFRIARWNT